MESDRDEEFAVFFVVHRRGIERYVTWRVGTEWAEVDDVCAEVFVTALRRFDEISELAAPIARGWLIRVADHLCSRHHRSRFRQDRAFRRVASTRGADAYDPFDDVFVQRLADDGQLADQARVVLASLSETYQEVLRLELDGPITGREMAAALGTTETAARLRLMRAKRAFGAEYARRYRWSSEALCSEGPS